MMDKILTFTANVAGTILLLMFWFFFVYGIFTIYRFARFYWL